MMTVYPTTSDADLVVARWLRKVELDEMTNSSAYSRGRRFSSLEYFQSKREADHQSEMQRVRQQWRALRLMQAQDLNNWYERRHLVYLPETGSARVLQEDLAKWLTNLKKVMPKSSTINKYMHKNYREQFAYVTIDALPNPSENTPGCLIAMFWQLNAGDSIGVGLSSYTQRLKADVRAAFTVTIEFDSLRLFTKELFPGIVTLSRNCCDPFLTIKQGRDTARLTHWGLQHER